jgi:SAM-dependent methyltransferase
MKQLYTGNNKNVLKVQDEFHKFIQECNEEQQKKYYSFLDTNLDLYMPVMYNDIILFEPRRNAEAQKIRMNLLPSFKNETVLDIGCNTGFLTYSLAKTAEFVFGIDHNSATIKIPKDILSYKNNINNVAFHETTIWYIYKYIREPVDNLLVLSIYHINQIPAIIPLISQYCKKHLYIEPTNHGNNTKEFIKDNHSKVLSHYGKVELLGYTDYQNRGLFQITL